MDLLPPTVFAANQLPNTIPPLVPVGGTMQSPKLPINFVLQCECASRTQVVLFRSRQYLCSSEHRVHSSAPLHPNCAVHFVMRALVPRQGNKPRFIDGALVHEWFLRPANVYASTRCGRFCGCRVRGTQLATRKTGDAPSYTNTCIYSAGWKADRHESISGRIGGNAIAMNRKHVSRHNRQYSIACLCARLNT